MSPFRMDVRNGVPAGANKAAELTSVHPRMVVLSSSLEIPGLSVDELVARNDPRLEPLLRAPSDMIDREVERLIVQTAQPLATSILSRHVRAHSAFRREDAEDVTATMSLRLVTKRRALRHSTDEAIQDFEKYVAILAYNAINDHLRRSFPARARLKNRLRYTLTHDPRLALWISEGVLVGGLRRWEGEEPVLDPAIDRANPTRAMLKQDDPAAALLAIFERKGGAVVFETLVELTAEWWRVADRPAESAEPITQHESGVAARMETREYLETLWSEIRQLLPMQRKALLLNLRSADTVNVIALLVLTGVARFDELATAVDMTPEGLAAIWNDLPFDDLRIAAMLDVPRQKVINLRRSAREKLSRRLSR